MDIFSEKACFKKPVLPEKPVKKPAFNLPAGFFNKTWVFSSSLNNRCIAQKASNPETFQTFHVIYFTLNKFSLLDAYYTLILFGSSSIIF
jgi:hypothetical protein